MDARGTVAAYTMSVRLAIRAFNGLLKQNQFNEDRLSQLDPTDRGNTL